MRTRTFFVLALLASLLVAGGVSYFASSHPDGLEYVAEKAGFADAAQESAAADSPLSGYQVRGVDDGALAGGLAGVAGAVVVLLAAGGLAYAVRRRSAGPSGPGTATPDDDPASGAPDQGPHPQRARGATPPSPGQERG